MKKRIEDMIPIAMQVIEEYESFRDEQGILKPIPATFQGSISGMGAAVLQMGLLPTLAVYADQESGAKDDQRRHLLRIIRRVIQGYTNYPQADVLREQPNDDLCRIAARLNPAQRKLLQAVLLDAAVAVKLSLRTFKLERS